MGETSTDSERKDLADLRQASPTMNTVAGATPDVRVHIGTCLEGQHSSLEVSELPSKRTGKTF
jgi:hypothetical protein